MKKNLLFLSILVWPFGLLLSFSTPYLSRPIYFLDILVLLLFTVTISSKKDRAEIVKDPLFGSISFFVTALTTSLVLSARSQSISQLITAGLYLARVFAYPAVYFVASRQPQQDLKKILFFSYFLFLCLSLLQYYYLPDLRFLKNLGFDDHYYRLVGTFLDPNFASAIFASASFVALYFGQYFALGFSMFALVLTFSRAGYVSFLVGLVIYAIIFKKYKSLLLLLFVALGIFLAPKPFGEGVNLFRTFSIFSRFDSWQLGWEYFLKRPVFGWGYNALSGLGISSSYFYLLATSGTVGFLGFTNLIWKILVTAPKILIVSLSVLLVHSFFNNTFFFAWIFFFAWSLLAVRFRE